MSKLKAISGHEIREDIDYNTRGIDPEDKEWCKYGKELCETLYYLKSEADKVIAGLKESRMSWIHRCGVAEEGERHHKYKRCWAMAQEWRNYATFCGMQSHCHNHRGFGKTAEIWTWKEIHAWKCVHRYKKLAEKFKPNNEVKNA